MHLPSITVVSALLTTFAPDPSFYPVDDSIHLCSDLGCCFPSFTIAFIGGISVFDHSVGLRRLARPSIGQRQPPTISAVPGAAKQAAISLYLIRQPPSCRTLTHNVFSTAFAIIYHLSQATKLALSQWRLILSLHPPTFSHKARCSMSYLARSVTRSSNWRSCRMKTAQLRIRKTRTGTDQVSQVRSKAAVRFCARASSRTQRVRKCSSESWNGLFGLVRLCEACDVTPN